MAITVEVEGLSSEKHDSSERNCAPHYVAGACLSQFQLVRSAMGEAQTMTQTQNSNRKRN